MAIAGYAYASRAENYYVPGGSPATWSAPVRVYAIHHDGTAEFLGSGTYTASESDALGQRFGYVAPNENQAANPDLDAYYAISPDELVHVAPLDDTAREFLVAKAPGYVLNDPFYYDISALPPGSIDEGKEYIVVAEWIDPDLGISWRVVAAIVEITPAFWSGISTTEDWHRNLDVISSYESGPEPEPPVFWTNIVGAKEVQ